MTPVRRAKEKRLKKDAGRTRWGQYFRSMKTGSREKRRDDDKTDSELDLDSRKYKCADHFSFGRQDECFDES